MLDPGRTPDGDDLQRWADTLKSGNNTIYDMLVMMLGSRFAKLVAFIRNTRAEIASEAEGLSKRCAMEADEQSLALDQKIRTLSDTIISCENRLAKLLSFAHSESANPL